MGSSLRSALLLLLLLCCPTASASLRGRLLLSDEAVAGGGASSTNSTLVGQAAAAGTPRVEKIGYIKTHKTGSTTLGSVLYRFGARRHKRFYCQGSPPHACKKAHILWPGKQAPKGQEYDLQLHHLNGNGELRGAFGHILAWYRVLLGLEGAWRKRGDPSPPAWTLVTPLRDPVTHYMAWFYYYAEPDWHPSLEQWVATRRNGNGQAAELGLKTAEEMAFFVKHMGWGHRAGADVLSGAVQVWVPMERFDEALLLIRHTLGWDLLDCLYARLFDSRREDATRWDGKPIKPTPKVKTLPPELVDKMRALNALDAVLYDAAIAALETGLADAMGSPGSPQRAAWDADAAEFDTMQAALAASLKRSEAGCVALRQWYSMSDIAYESTVGDDGYAAVPPAATAEAMLAAYEASGKTRFC